MQLIFHGGAQEVGRSCIEIRTSGDRYLVDCGVKFHHGGMDYPAKVFDIRTVDGIFLSHAHLDHSGGLPFFEHYKMSCPIFCTKETRDMCKVLLKDSWHIAHFKHICEPYQKDDMLEVFNDIKLVNLGKQGRFRSLKYELLNAGHIPGSMSIKVIAEGKKILYTGDYNTQTTMLMEGAQPESWGEVDVLITEATYGIKDHPDRIKTRDDLLKKVEEVLARGGRVVIPVFAVGRAQEILMMLARKKWSVPIYMDGMAKKITRIIAEGPSQYVRNKDVLRKSFKNVKRISNPKFRERVASKPGIFIATSGMMQGGPVMSYMEHVWDDPKSAVLLTGYQVKGTNGWYLHTEGTWKMDGKILPVKCEVQRFDFSAHISRSDIENTILAVKPKVLVFNHGDPQAIQALTEWAEANTHCKVYAPKVGEELDIDDGNISHLRSYTADDGFTFPAEHQHGDTCVPFSQDITVEYDE